MSDESVITLCFTICVVVFFGGFYLQAWIDHKEKLKRMDSEKHEVDVLIKELTVRLAQPVQKPLTDEQIVGMIDTDDVHINQLGLAIARAIETAHNIK